METESSTEKPKVVGSKEMRTVFVSNLAMAVTEEKLREKFSEVRLHVHLQCTCTCRLSLSNGVYDTTFCIQNIILVAYGIV